MLTMWLRAVTLAGLVGFAAAPAFAQDDDFELTPEQQQMLAKMRSIWESLDRQTGRIGLGDNLATLNVPSSFYFLDADDAQRVLVDLWGNPPGEPPLGMLFPADRTPFGRDSWAVTIEYSDDGHVSDADAAEIDYDDLLTDMRSDIRAENPSRTKAGYEPIELVGWAEPPKYDGAARKLYWAKELRFGDSPETTLNYEIRALGRTGVLSMTFIAGTSQLDEINREREAVLSMAAFNEGSRYEDFDPSYDKVAAYGIGALIAGKVAAKAGLFAAGLLLLKKFGIFILVGIGALWRRFAGLFARRTA
jgi:uncharacterized membrane-anchored protein